MADTKNNIDLVSGVWVNVYDQLDFNSGSELTVQNIGTSDLYYSVSANEPSKEYTAYKIFIRGEKINLLDGDGSIWFVSPWLDGLINADKYQNGEPQTSAYGELITVGLDPEIQISAEYNTFVDTNFFQIFNGTALIENGEFVVSVTDAADFAGIFSDKQIISRAGQGSVTRFSARFDLGLPNSRITAGLVSTGDAIEFGYLNEDFGIFYDHSGLNGIQELQITTPASGSENATITLNGIPFTVPLTVGTVEHNAFEIAQSLTAQTPFFVSSQNGDTVVIKGLFAGPQPDVFSFVSSTAIGVFTEIQFGANVTNIFVPQADWNKDTKPDLIPQNTNYFTIRWNGDIEFFIQDSATGKNILVHTFGLPNSTTTPMFSINSFRLGWVASNTGNTTKLSVYGTQGAAFNEGMRLLTSPAKGTLNVALGLGLPLINILTIRARHVFGNKTNLGIIRSFSINVSANGNNKNAIVEVIRNATFTGLEPNYIYHNKSDSIVEINNIASVVSGGDSSGLFAVGPDEEKTIEGKLINNPISSSETLTIAMRIISGSAADVTASIAWQEDI